MNTENSYRTRNKRSSSWMWSNFIGSIYNLIYTVFSNLCIISACTQQHLISLQKTPIDFKNILLQYFYETTVPRSSSCNMNTIYPRDPFCFDPPHKSSFLCGSSNSYNKFTWCARFAFSLLSRIKICVCGKSAENLRICLYRSQKRHV